MALLLIFLPFSIFMISVAMISLTINWLLEGNYIQKIRTIRSDSSFLWIFIFYLVHLIWITGTTDLDWGLHDLKIKLPMFVLPLVIGTSEKISRFELKILLTLYVISVFLASIFSSFLFYKLNGIQPWSVNQFSLFVPHITWSLMVLSAIFIAIWLLFNYKQNGKIIFLVLTFWLLFYLFLIQVFTGIIIGILTAISLSIWLLFRKINRNQRWIVIFSLVMVTISSGWYIKTSYNKFHTFDPVDANKLEKYTVNGNTYHHNLSSKLAENGHWVDLYICEPELEKSWNKRSNIKYGGQTTSGEEIRRTIIRYLTSKDLRKDSSGISQLTNTDILRIENGKTNYRDTLKFNLNNRLYVIWWELYNYSNGISPNGYSISQRLEALKTACHIIKKNNWFGVGTGDIREAFKKQYAEDRSTLAIQNQIRTHNQFLTFWITFGVIGLFIIIIALFYAPVRKKRFSNYLFFVVAVSGLLSFFNEDTLETHQGITHFAIFFFLFLFADISLKNEPDYTPQLKE